MENQIIGQTLGILATVLTFVSYQVNKKRPLLIIQTLATISTCLSFLFLDAATGFALNIVCIVRNITYYFVERKSKLYYPSTALLTIAMVILGIISWQGPISLLMIMALAINTVILSFGRPQILRQSILVTSTMVIIYNISVFSIGGIANEAIAIISSVIGILRYSKVNTKNKS